MKGDHFHLLLRVPDKVAALVGWAEADFISRLEVLAGGRYAQGMLRMVETWRRNGSEKLVAELGGLMVAGVRKKDGIRAPG